MQEDIFPRPAWNLILYHEVVTAPCTITKDPGGDVYLSNTILVRRTLTERVTKKWSIKMYNRSACAIEFDGIRIANVHLTGKRYDDELVANNKFGDRLFEKSVQVEEVTSVFNADIIGGDFNGSLDYSELDSYPLYTSLNQGTKQEFRIIIRVVMSLWPEKVIHVRILRTTSVFKSTPDWIYTKPGTKAMTSITVP